MDRLRELVAMEDILEEIVGKYPWDEHDEEESADYKKCRRQLYRKRHDGSGRLGRRDFRKIEKEEYETLNGFLIDQLDRIPGEDEQCVVEYEGYRFTVHFC